MGLKEERGYREKTKKNQNVTDQFSDFLSHVFSGGTLGQANGCSEDELNEMNQIAVGLYNSGRYQEAHAVFHELVRLNHLSHAYMFGLASCLHKMGRYVNAANVYLSSILLNIKEDNLETYFHMAQCLISANQSLDQAVSYLKHFLDRSEKTSFKEFRQIATAQLAFLKARGVFSQKENPEPENG